MRKHDTAAASLGDSVATMAALPLNDKRKCYWTHDVNAEHQSFVFSQTRAEAIYHSEAYEWGTDWVDIRARRMPEFDAYADTEIPKKILLEKGWWFECHGWRCSKTLTEENEPLIDNNKVYCNAECRDRKK